MRSIIDHRVTELFHDKDRPKVAHQVVVPEAHPTLTHQDDLESPLVGDTLEELFDKMGDWGDMSPEDVVKDMMKDKDSEFFQYEIIRQEIKQVPLTKADLKEIEEKVSLAEDEEDNDSKRKL